MGMVKANAYGHGIVECSQTLVAEGVSMLGVAFADEAIPVRIDSTKDSPLHTAPIFVTTPPFPHEADEYCRLNLAFSAASLETVRAFSAAAERHGITLSAHLYVDTGMRRDGIEPQEALAFMQSCEHLPNIRLDGICTHFATADESPSSQKTSFAHQQLQRFHDTLHTLNNAGFTFAHVHAANSAALGNLPQARFTLVRAGFSLYGYNPSNDLSEPFANLHPVMTLRTSIVALRRVPAGTSVSYGRRYITSRETTIATLPIGYADGFPRGLTNKAFCLIRGRRFPIVGTICMDECMVDVSDESFSVGEDVILLGEQGNSRIFANELAAALGTIPYEVLAGISARVRREYINNT